MKFTTSFIVLTCAFVAQASTTANVLSDLSTINTDVTNLDSQIKAFPNSGGSLTNALAIHSAAGGLVTAINTGTNDTNNVIPLPVSVSDANSILSSVNTLKPNIISALTDIVAKKPGFTSLPVGGIPALVLSDLKSLNASTVAFEVALIAKTPSSLLASASSLTSSINAALATAIAAYS